MKKHMLASVFAAIGVLGCGESSLGGYPSVGCDVPSPDVSAPQDAQITDTPIDAAVAPDAPRTEDAPVDRGVETGVISAPYNLTVRVYLPGDHQGVQLVSVTRLMRVGPNINYPTNPSRPMFFAGEYEPVTAELREVREESIIASVNWVFQYNAMGDTATSGLFDRDPMTLAYRYRGRVEVTDQYHRVWVGYPTPIDNVSEIYLRFVPGPCAPDFAMRRDNICIR